MQLVTVKTIQLKLMNLKRIGILLFLFHLTFVCIHAQRGYEIGIIGGSSHYFGELNESFDFKEFNPSVSVFGKYNFDNRIAWRLGMTFGKISGDDKNSKSIFNRTRNLNFYSAITDINTQLEFNFFPLERGTDYIFTPYIFAGLSAYHFNPKTTLDGEVYELRDYGTEGQARDEEYYLWQFGVNYGLGLKWYFSYNWGLNVEISSRWLFNDYLDDVSTVYPDLTELITERGPEAVALSDRSGVADFAFPGAQRGNSENNDMYLFIQVGVTYYFGRVRCANLSLPRLGK